MDWLILWSEYLCPVHRDPEMARLHLFSDLLGHQGVRTNSGLFSALNPIPILFPLSRQGRFSFIVHAAFAHAKFFSPHTSELFNCMGKGEQNK